MKYLYFRYQRIKSSAIKATSLPDRINEATIKLAFEFYGNYVLDVATTASWNSRIRNTRSAFLFAVLCA